MIEVTQEKFRQVLTENPYKTGFLHGEDSIRYYGKKGLFKNQCFAMRTNDKYFTDKFFV
jgi:hypothetical protein